jgi:hypothetical protein
MQIECPLCKNLKIKEFYKERSLFKRLFYRCEECLLIFLDPRMQLPQSLEKSRYESHNNDERNDGYENFLRTLIDPLKEFINPKMYGLDFGCGPYPMLCEILTEDGFSIKGYDPYFEPNEALLRGSYDFITSCEVVEHFNEPLKSFEVIDSMLIAGGVLGLKTTLYSEDIDFSSWYYMRDDTHVSFYSKETFEWLANHFHYEIQSISKSTAFFKKLRG